jgi:hypothetical protein
MSNLYQLTNDFMEIVNQVEEYDLDSEVLASVIDGLQAPIEEKVENIVKYMKSLEALADAKKLEAKRLSDSASSDLKKVEWFKNYMADNLKKANITKLQAGIFSLGWRKGTEVVQIDESKIPNQYDRPDLWVTQPPKFLGKAELKKMFKADEQIPGVSIVRNPDSLVVK